MRVRRLGSTLLSGLCAYYVMAACSGGNSGSGGADPATTPPGVPGSSGSPARDASSGAPSQVPNAMADTWYASGSRLKLRYFEGTDGSKQFSGWFDSARKENCSFLVNADGSTRCMPYENVPLLITNSFSNATCTDRLLQLPNGTAAPKYVITVDVIGRRLFPVAAAFTGQRYASGAGCTAVGPDKNDYYSVGPEIAALEFVQATEKTAP